MDITAVIPYRNGQATIGRLLDSLPKWMPVVIVDDQSDAPLQLNRENTRLIRLEKRGYFSGAVNRGIQLASGNVLVLNQDVQLAGSRWLEFLAEAERPGYGIAGHAQMRHPHWPQGYVQGQFMFLGRRALEAVGGLNERDYPLWGATAELQLRMARRGFRARPLAEIEGLTHARPAGAAFGASIQAELEAHPESRDWLIRTPPMVSVIVTSRNYGRYLSDCVNSLIGGPTSLGEMPGQTFQSFEIIIVDDGSSDETAEVGKSLADPWRAIRYIRREVTGGTPAANNTGIQAAHGKFITILCADDLREPWGLEELYRVVERDPHAVPYDDMWVVADGKRVRPWEMSEFSLDRILVRNMMHAGVMFARRGWERAGGYPEVMKDGREDWAFNVALAQVGYCGVHVPKAGYLYRREGQNRSLTNQGPEWRDYFVDQMHQLFPRLYGGERPMGCCGGSNVVDRNNPGAETQMQAANMPVGAEGMVLLEYVGGNAGTETWYGAVSGARYIFGGSRKRGYVDARDVAGFLKAFESRRRVFQVASATSEPSKPAPTSAPQTPAPEPAHAPDTPGPAERAPAERAPAATEPAKSPEPEPARKSAGKRASKRAAKRASKGDVGDSRNA